MSPLETAKLLGAVAADASNLINVPLISLAASIFQQIVQQVQLVQDQKGQALVLIDLIRTVLFAIKNKLSELEKQELGIPNLMSQNIRKLERFVVQVLGQITA